MYFDDNFIRHDVTLLSDVHDESGKIAVVKFDIWYRVEYHPFFSRNNRLLIMVCCIKCLRLVADKAYLRVLGFVVARFGPFVYPLVNHNTC